MQGANRLLGEIPDILSLSSCRAEDDVELRKHVDYLPIAGMDIF